MQAKNIADKKIHLAIYTTQDIIDIVQTYANESNVSKSRAGEEIIREWIEARNKPQEVKYETIN